MEIPLHSINSDTGTDTAWILIVNQQSRFYMICPKNHTNFHPPQCQKIWSIRCPKILLQLRSILGFAHNLQ